MPPAVLPPEPKQTATREITEEAPIEMGHFHFSWHIPELRNPDVPILDVLATLLGGGRSSRLYQQVRREEGSRELRRFAWTYSPGNPGLFGMSAPGGSGQIRRRPHRDARGDRAHEGQAPVTESGVDQGREAIHRRHTREPQDDARPGAGSWRQLDGSGRSEFLRGAISRRSEAHHALPTCNASRAPISPRENRTLFTLLPKGATEKAVRYDRGEVTQDNAVQKFDRAERPAPAGEGRSSPAVR